MDGLESQQRCNYRGIETCRISPSHRRTSRDDQVCLDPEVCILYLSSSQKEAPILETLKLRCRNRFYKQKGPIMLRTTHLMSFRILKAAGRVDLFGGSGGLSKQVNNGDN